MDSTQGVVAAVVVVDDAMNVSPLSVQLLGMMNAGSIGKRSLFVHCRGYTGSPVNHRSSEALRKHRLSKASSVENVRLSIKTTKAFPHAAKRPFYHVEARRRCRDTARASTFLSRSSLTRLQTSRVVTAVLPASLPVFLGRQRSGEYRRPASRSPWRPDPVPSGTRIRSSA